MSFEDQFEKLVGVPSDPMAALREQPGLAEPVAEPTDGPSKEAFEQITQRLEGVTVQSSEAALMARLAADPDFAEVIRRKRDGKPVKFAEESVTRPAEKIEPLADDATPQQLVEHISKIQERSLDNLLEARLQKVLQPITQTVNQFGQYIQGQQATEAEKQIKEAAKKYPDFKDHTKEMMQLSREAPGLNAEELYALVKIRKGMPITTDRSLETERPTSNTTRSGRKAQPKEPVIGSGGLRNYIASAMQNIDLSID